MANWFNNVTLNKVDVKDNGTKVFYATTIKGHQVRGISKYIDRYEVGTQVNMLIENKNKASYVNAIIPFVKKETV